MTNKLDYHKIVSDILNEKTLEFETYHLRQQLAHRVVIRNRHQSVQVETVTEEIKSMGHTIINLWNIRHRGTGYPLLYFVLNIEPETNNNEIYHIEHLENMRVQIKSPHQKQNNIP
jgi:hypothetical protein